MKKIIYTLLTVITFSFITTNANAVTTYGSPSCGNWIKNKETKTNDWHSVADTTWLLGFLSGYAVYSNDDILKNVDKESINLWINNYCRANPLHSVSKAGNALFDVLKKQNGL